MGHVMLMHRMNIKTPPWTMAYANRALLDGFLCQGWVHNGTKISVSNAGRKK